MIIGTRVSKVWSSTASALALTLKIVDSRIIIPASI
jgi:hypothetical protein